jgi:hypothetical protein
VKRSEKTFISFHSKRNENIGNKTKICWKRNKAKISCVIFSLVGSEKFEAERSEKILFFSHERAKRIFAKPAHPTAEGLQE